MKKWRKILSEFKPDKIIFRPIRVGPTDSNQKARAVMVNWKELKKRIRNYTPEENEQWLEEKYNEATMGSVK